MARADYHAPKVAMKDIIEADSETNTAHVFIESEKMHSITQSPRVGIYGINRTAPEEKQRIAAGEVTVYHYEMQLIILVHNPNGLSEAARDRDEFLGKLEIVLMKNRTLNETVQGLWLNGGELEAANIPDKGGYLAGAELLVTTEIHAVV